MATIQNSFQLYDGMSSPLRAMNNALNAVLDSFESLQSASSNAVDSISIEHTRQQLSRVGANINAVENGIHSATQEQEEFNSMLADGVANAGGLQEKIAGLAAGLGIAVGAKSLLDTAVDTKRAGNTLAAQTGARGDDLSQMQNDMKSLYMDNMGESMEDVATSMSTVRQITGQVGETLKNTTSNALLMRDSFDYDVTESVRAVDMMMKKFGLTSEEAYDQIIQGTQKGLNKNGDFLDSLNEYSNQFQKLGLSSTDMMNMFVNGVENGTFSVDKLGDTIKEFSIRALDGSNTTMEGFNALGLDAEDMASKFGEGGESAKKAFQQTILALESLKDPVAQNTAGVNLFGTMWEDLGSKGVFALANMNGEITNTTDNLQQLNDIKYDDAYSALEAMGRTINVSLAEPVGMLANGFQSVFQFITDNWSIIQPILLGLAAAVLIYTVVTKGAAAATKMWAIMHSVLSAVMSAGPLGVVLIVIVGIITAVYAVVAAINKVTGSTISATGIICGSVAFAAAAIGNIVIGLLNGLIQFVWSIFVEPFIGIIEWILNVTTGGFDSFGDGVKNLLGNIISWFLSLGKVVTKIIDAIFGSDWTAGLSSLQDSVLEWGKNENAITLDRNAPDINHSFEYGKAWDAGYDFGEGIDEKLSSFNPNNLFNGEDMIKNYTDTSGNGLYDVTPINQDDTLTGIKDNTDSIKNSVSTSEEDLKYLREIAEKEAVNRFTTAEIKIDMTNNNTINTDNDIDGFTYKLGESLYKQMQVAKEGV